MRLMRLAGATVAFLLAAGHAGAQTYENLVIEVGGSPIRLKGGEHRSASGSSAGVEINKTTSHALSMTNDMCGFGIASQVVPEAVTGWQVDVTPTKVDGDAVTFQVRWARVRDGGRPSSDPHGALTLSLKRGESFPLDTVAVPSTMTQLYDACGIRAMSVRVGVAAYPPPEQDRRLVETDLWLIERLPNGAEHNQLVTVRGRFNEPTSFYFDTISDSGSALDFFGEFTTTPTDGLLSMALQTRSRLTQGGQSTMALRATPPRGLAVANFFGAREVSSTLRLSPADVIAVELPRLGENDGGAFAGRSYSIRVRSRQIR